MKSPSQKQPSPPPSKGTGTRVPPIKGMPIGNQSGMNALTSSKAKQKVKPAQLSAQGPSNPKAKTVALPHRKNLRKAKTKKMPMPPGGMGSGLIAGAFQSSGQAPALSQGRSYGGGAAKPGINRPPRAQTKY